MNPFPPIEELLPHRGNMLLLEQMLVADDDSAICCAAPTTAAPGMRKADGSMPAWIGIELMAQTIAAHAAFVARLSGKPPRPGVLLGTRAYKAEESFFLPAPHFTSRHVSAIAMSRVSAPTIAGLLMRAGSCWRRLRSPFTSPKTSRNSCTHKPTEKHSNGQATRSGYRLQPVSARRSRSRWRHPALPSAYMPQPAQ